MSSARSSYFGVLLTLLVLLFSAAARAQGSPPLVLAWLGSGGALDRATVAALEKQPRPDHVVLLIHGYSETRDESAKNYKILASTLEKEFRDRGQRVLVVGVQWEAALHGDKLPWKLVSDYLKIVNIARGVGHGSMRELLAALQRRFPSVPVSIFSQSLGSQVAAAAAYPGLEGGAQSPVYAPKTHFHFAEIVLGQADLDYDVWFKSRLHLFDPAPVAKLLWLTVAPYRLEGDDTLEARSLVRGKQAANRFPRMTTRQYDGLFKKRALYLDDVNVIGQHGFLTFYNQARVERLVAAASYVTRGGPEPSDMQQMDQILTMPASVDAFLPWLDNPSFSCRMYALWRLEHLVDGGSQHFADETIDKVDLLLRDRPTLVWKARKTSKCTSIRRGYWPTQAQMTDAGAPPSAKHDHM